MNPKINVGDTLTCAETGKRFIATSNGFTFNYARDSSGNFYSDAGVNIRENRDMLDRSKPFGCYLSTDGRHVTGWKGNILGQVIFSSVSRTGWHNSQLTHVQVTDNHGGRWHGKGSGRGMYITLRPSKA